MRVKYVLFALLVACVDERPATWSYTHAAIIAPNCATANCHSTVASTAGIDLSDREGAYVFLVGKLCNSKLPENPPGNYAFPYHPERSPLIHLLHGDAKRLMPPDTPLPEPEIEVVERWVLEGAKCD